ncbi:MAG: hypothetical protein CUN57_00970, partial [Phototrophicales bacterium]
DTPLWLDVIQTPVMIIDRSGKIIAFNRTATTECGLSESQVLNKIIWETPLKPDSELQSAFPLDSVASTLTRFRTVGSEQSHINWTIRSLLSNNGQPQWVCTGEVVDDSTPPYRQMFEHNPAVMLLIDPNDGRIIDANRAATRFYGYTVVELVQKKLQEITAQPHPDLIADLRRGIENEQEFLVFQHHTADERTL